MNQALLTTPLGPIVALADTTALYLLDFALSPHINRKIQSVQQATKTVLVPGHNQIIDALESELTAYFQQKLYTFTIPFFLIGTPFQKKVWSKLLEIPYGTTVSYYDLAFQSGNSNACRAVARANATNNLAIIVPCHRVINKNGLLGGYSSGIHHKKELLDLEQTCTKDNAQETHR